MAANTAEECLRAFAGCVQDEHYVDSCIAADPTGTCQRHSVSEHSPGPVADHEVVARWVMAPRHTERRIPYDLTEALFFDAFDVGASVSRIEPNGANQLPAIHRRGEDDAIARRAGSVDRPADPNYVYLGVVQLNAGELRRVVLNTQQVLSRTRLYDTGIRGHEMHGDVMVDTTDINGRGKAHKEARKLLRTQLAQLARSQGLFVSPFLTDEHRARIDTNLRLS